jgi:hypothetical protein
LNIALQWGGVITVGSDLHSLLSIDRFLSVLCAILGFYSGYCFMGGYRTPSTICKSLSMSVFVIDQPSIHSLMFTLYMPYPSSLPSPHSPCNVYLFIPNKLVLTFAPRTSQPFERTDYSECGHMPSPRKSVRDMIIGRPCLQCRDQIIWLTHTPYDAVTG